MDSVVDLTLVVFFVFCRCKAPDCDKAFSSKFKLMRHELIHGSDKKHECPYCQKSFTRKDHLKNHLKVRTREVYCISSTLNQSLGYPSNQ